MKARTLLASAHMIPVVGLLALAGVFCGRARRPGADAAGLPAPCPA